MSLVVVRCGSPRSEGPELAATSHQPTSVLISGVHAMNSGSVDARPGLHDAVIVVPVHGMRLGSVDGRFGVHLRLPGAPSGIVGRAFGVSPGDGNGRTPRAALRTLLQ